MAWNQTGDKSLSESMVALYTDAEAEAEWRIYASVN